MPWYARLTWTEGSPSFKGTGFKVYASVNGGSYGLVTTLPITTTQYDYAVSAGNTYAFRVTEYKTISGIGDIESPPAAVTVHVPGTPARASAQAVSSNLASVRARVEASTPKLVFQKKVSGAWQDLASLDNKIHTEGGALSDWTQWSHWGQTAYWASCSQSGASGMGSVFQGLCAPAASPTLLYDDYPYTVVSGTRYAVAIALRAAPATTVRLQASLRTSSGTIGTSADQYVFLDSTWRYFWFEVVPNTSTSAAGLAIALYLPRPHGTTIYAAAPFFAQAVTDSLTIPCVREYRVRAESGAYASSWAESPKLYFWKKARLTWTQGNTNQPGEMFLIQKKIGSGTWEDYAGTALGTTTFDDTELVENTTLYYRVYEAFGGRLSPYAETSVTVPSAWIPAENKPQNFTITVTP